MLTNMIQSLGPHSLYIAYEITAPVPVAQISFK